MSRLRLLVWQVVEALAERPKSKTEKDWEPTGGRYKYTRKEVQT